jgi:hypothetical protein
MLGFALALLVLSVVLNGCLLAGYRQQSERARRLERDKHVAELERELLPALPRLPGDGSLAHVLGVIAGIWLRERYRR